MGYPSLSVNSAARKAAVESCTDANEGFLGSVKISQRHEHVDGTIDTCRKAAVESSTDTIESFLGSAESSPSDVKRCQDTLRQFTGHVRHLIESIQQLTESLGQPCVQGRLDLSKGLVDGCCGRCIEEFEPFRSRSVGWKDSKLQRRRTAPQ